MTFRIRSQRMIAYIPMTLILGALLLTRVPECLSQTVAITVDDLPYASGSSAPIGSNDGKTAEHINRRLLRSFSRHHIPVTGFVIGQTAEQIGIDRSRRIFGRWTRSGFDLGNHTYSHADFDSLSVSEFEYDFERNEISLGPFLHHQSQKSSYFRFPYNHTGDTKEKHDAFAKFLMAHDYRLAPCTIDNSDYEFNTTYIVALGRHDLQTAAKLRSSYIAYTAAEIDWYSRLDKHVFGHEVPHIMLLHDSQLNADTIDGVIALFERRGYHFVSLSEALQDPAYSTPETFISKFGPMWGYRWANELGVNVDGRDEPNPPKWIDEYVGESRKTAN
jgi:peptidoglycan-N-acetylglucosamine deacetylase